MPESQFIIPFCELGLHDAGRVGGKIASLGDMLRSLGSHNINIPDGFALTVDAFTRHLQNAGIDQRVYSQLQGVNTTDAAELGQTASEIRKAISEAPLPDDVAEALHKAYTRLGSESVAVRSSAVAEDHTEMSLAGQHNSYLNVRGIEELDRAVRNCMASLFTDRAIVYCQKNELDSRQVLISVGVQRMVGSDLACSGNMCTRDPESGILGVVVIDAAWGLGESVARGRVNPDEFWVHKERAVAGFEPIIHRVLGEKLTKTVCAEQNGESNCTLKQVPVSCEDQKRYCLSNEEILQLARWAVIVEEHYHNQGLDVNRAIDLEWAKDGHTGKLYLLQAHAQASRDSSGDRGTLEFYRLSESGKVLVTGKSVGSRISSGLVRIVHSPDSFPTVLQGEVLVAKTTDPEWESVVRKASAVVTDRGGRASNTAAICCEIGIPCIVGALNATTVLNNGQQVTVSCIEGDLGRVYEGQLKYETQEVSPESVPSLDVSLMLNIADPAMAFKLCQFPVAGVGLLGIEFLMANGIGIHPMALQYIARVPEKEVRDQIDRLAAGYDSRSEFFVEKLASGIARTAGAFYPRPVIVRFSDFKTNEYAQLLGGAVFEPVENNPMMGFRGASRYYDERYRDGFALECAAIKKVIASMGLNNVIPMVPFCRTPREGRLVLEEMGKNGLIRGEQGLQVYVMCEIPDNVIRADEFCEYFDGFSIGSNNLTQLSLAVDRDSELLIHLFDETDPGVKRMIETLIERAHAHGRTVSICGEAPSNDPGFAQWLASKNIDSISLNPDALLPVIHRFRVSDSDLETKAPQRLQETLQNG